MYYLNTSYNPNAPIGSPYSTISPPIPYTKPQPTLTSITPYTPLYPTTGIISRGWCTTWIQATISTHPSVHHTPLFAVQSRLGLVDFDPCNLHGDIYSLRGRLPSQRTFYEQRFGLVVLWSVQLDQSTSKHFILSIASPQLYNIPCITSLHPSRISAL